MAVTIVQYVCMTIIALAVIFAILVIAIGGRNRDGKGK